MPTSEFAAYCVELLGSLGSARAKRMFGGHGIYVDDIFVAIVAAERLYLKADAQTQAQFEAAGCQPFVYEGGGKRVQMSYWTAPDEAMESPALMRPWARLALDAALRARKAAPVKRAKAAKAPRTGSPPAAKPKR